MKAKVTSSEEGKMRTGDKKKKQDRLFRYWGLDSCPWSQIKNVLGSVLPEARIVKEYLWALIPGLTPK